ncbi:glycosyltransferase [Schaalia suimastitidis]|uniref:glycosyltransferase n=1 Tax=Schaalia suimastitidis TaxID=121163 RepID=UPI0010401F70|nr:glycosyltransferase [Schaalia suimastitidis]
MNTPLGNPGTPIPRVVVLMATFNGAQWIKEQLDSILSQADVDVRVIASDDGSTDTTCDILRACERVQLMPARSGKSGSAQNFCHLVTHADIQLDEYVAFADQDDIWYPHRLGNQIQLIRDRNADVVSSSIDALYPDGTTRRIRKDYPQRRLDFVCESAGPGSTYVFTPAAFAALRADLQSGIVDIDEVGFHDWLTYALLRARGLAWHIDGTPTLAYRQHEANEMGANDGAHALKRRARMLGTGWYRQQFALTAQWAGAVSTDPQLRADLEHTYRMLTDKGLLARLRLAWHCRHLRRRRRDQIGLALTELIGLW